MRKKSFLRRKSSFIAPVILLSGLIQAFALDPASYSVPLKKFHSIVYYENSSFYRIRVSGEVFRPLTTPFQRIIRRRIQGNTTTVDIETGRQNRSVPPGDRKKYLKNTRFLNLYDAGLKKHAKKFRNSRNTIGRIESYVHGFIRNKTTGIPLLPARNILASRSGDCTEHTILAVSLLRANGIPARAVVGMILVPEFNNKKNVMVYHMWAEAYRNNRWHMVDATRPGVKKPNRYIALAYHSLASEMPLSYFRAIAAIQNIEVYYNGETERRR